MSHCDNCGLCCTHMSSPPFMPDEFDALPETLREEITRYLDSPRFDDGGPCIWLDLVSGQCRHYDLRPDVCRDFDVGGESCLTQRAAALTIDGQPLFAGDRT